jgi:hypothetical protein
MIDEIIIFETAKLANGKGFPTNLFNTSWYNSNGIILGSIDNLEDKTTFLAPTQSLLQRWLREMHTIYITIVKETLGSDEWAFAYEISYLPKEHENEKRRCPHFVNIDSFRMGYATYSGAWDSYEEALENGLQQALKLIP